MATYYYKAGLTTGTESGADWANAFKTFQLTKDTATAGDKVYGNSSINGPELLTATVDDDTNVGTASSYIEFIAVNGDESADPNDDRDGTQCVISGDGTASHVMLMDGVRSFQSFENFTFTGAVNNGIDFGTSNSSAILWHGCHFDNNGGYGVDGQSNCPNNVFLQCSFDNNTLSGCQDLDTGTVISLCQATGNSARGIDTHSTFNVIVECLAYGNTTEGFYCSSGALYYRCTSDDNSDGINISGIGCIALFNRLTNNTTLGLQQDATTDRLLSGFNSFRGNGTEQSGDDGYNIYNSDTSMSADGYVAAGNYSLTDSAENRRVAKNIGSWGP